MVVVVAVVVAAVVVAVAAAVATVALPHRELGSQGDQPPNPTRISVI